MNKTKSLKYVFRVFFEAGKGKAVCVVFLYLLISLIPSLLLIINRKVFDLFSAEVFSFAVVSALIAFFAFLQIFSKALSLIQKRLMSLISHGIQTEIQKELQSKMLRMSYIEFDSSDTLDLVERVSKNIPEKCSSSVFMIMDVVSVIIQLFTAVIILVDIHWLVPVILIAFTIPYIFLYKKMCFDNYFKEINQGKKQRKNWYLIKMLFDKHYNKELKVYDCFQYLGEKEKRINEELHFENYEIAKKYSLLGVLLEIIKSIGKGLCMLLTVFLIIYRGAGLSAFTVLMQAMDSMQSCLMDIFSKFRDFSSLNLVFQDYEKFHRLADETVSDNVLRIREDVPFIEMENVNFSYPTKKGALHDVGFQIKKGEKIAIVGKNGSGKSTLINVLLGFYKPETGNVRVMGMDLAECVSDFRKNTVYIMQNTPRYIFSIDDNLNLGRVRSNQSVEKVLEIDDILSKAPRKGQTLLGEENDDQYNISGGEWAKLGIARNSRKENPALYIMDEPTAALDPIVESKIFESFNEITDNKTAIFISHRLGMVSLADRILVLDSGSIAEQGTHAELMERKGLYYSMYYEQIQLYDKEKQAANSALI